MQLLIPLLLIEIIILSFICYGSLFSNANGTNIGLSTKSVRISLLIIAALLPWLTFLFYIFIWAFILGDDFSERGTWYFAMGGALILSIVYAGFVFHRIRTQRMTIMGQQLHIWFSVVLLFIALSYVIYLGLR